MTAPRYQDVKAAEIPESHRRRRHARPRRLRRASGARRGPVDGIAADPIYLDVSVPPGKRKRLPVETTRHAFAYVFAGSGKFCNASGPLAVPTEGVDWPDTAAPRPRPTTARWSLFDRGDEVVVQAGRGRHPLPAGLRQAARGARRLVRPDRDEHRRRDRSGARRPPRRHLPARPLAEALRRSRARALSARALGLRQHLAPLARGASPSRRKDLVEFLKWTIDGH